MQTVFAFLVACLALTGWKEYTDKTNHCKLKYPDTWVQKDSEIVATYFVSPLEDEKDFYQENVNLKVIDLTGQHMTLEGITESSRQLVVHYFGDSSMIYIKDVTLAGEQAKEMFYNVVDDVGRKLKIKQYFIIKDNTGYAIAYTAAPSQYKKYENIADETIRSLEIF